MKVAELEHIVFDKVALYEDDGNGGYSDLYDGEIADIPVELLCSDIRSIGAKRKGILDIRIQRQS